MVDIFSIWVKNNYVDHDIRVRGVNLSLAIRDGTSYLVLNIWSACQRFVFNGLLEIVTSLCCPDLISNNALSCHILDCYLFASGKGEDTVLGLLSANVCRAQVRLRNGILLNVCRVVYDPAYFSINSCYKLSKFFEY